MAAAGPATARTPARTSTGAPRRVDKHRAILDAALDVFARRGYADTSLDEVAELAGVAKPTIYNHFGDKAGLFAAVVETSSQDANTKVANVIAATSTSPDDLRSELETLARSLVGCLQGGAGSATMRLQLVEGARFPELISRVRDGNRDRTLDLLAGKLAQLSATGHLSVRDPGRAARQLMALVSDEPLVNSGFGAQPVDPDVVDRAVVEGVDTFLAAFGPRDAEA
ncbi:TetR/AcrR family transcriptional regulator [Luteimicrobium sp. DT211]|uniref:TetR/AcrR family transcriptional regulator n=1 Tax=Luteimicrobium sp. DT211 TaxID=3393412 RepID=UPI003CE9B6E9